MLHSPRVTRSQAAAAATPEADFESRRTTTTEQGAEMEAPALQTVLRELIQLREERQREREELQRLRRMMEERGRGELEERQNQGQYRSFFNLKPDKFDGTESFYEYVAQFELIARANLWSEGDKTLAFAASLRGKARSVLDGLGENFNYTEIKSKLELRFGDRVNFQNSYSVFINRKIKIGEDFATFGGELEKLAQFVYPECAFEVQDKIACAQFVAGLSEGFVKRTLQLEGISSLRTAIERAKVVQEISGGGDIVRERRRDDGARSETQNSGGTVDKGNFSRKEETGFLRDTRKDLQGAGRKFSGVRENLHKERGNFNREVKNFNGKECWQCGSSSHFRAECPTWLGQRSGN